MLRFFCFLLDLLNFVRLFCVAALLVGAPLWIYHGAALIKN